MRASNSRIAVAAGAIVVAAALLVAGVPAVAGPSATISYRECLETLGPGRIAYSLQNRGSTRVRLVALRGKDFEIGGFSRVSVTSGPAPACSLSGQPATLRCERFELAKNAWLTLQIATTGAGRTAERAITDGAEPNVTSFFPVQAQRPQPRGTVRFQGVGKTRLRIVGRNTGYVRWTDILFQPRRGVRIRRVLSFRVIKARRLALRSEQKPPCKLTEGGGTTTTPRQQEVACHADVAAMEVFLLFLLASDARAVGDVVVKTADGRLTTLDKIGG